MGFLTEKNAEVRRALAASPPDEAGLIQRAFARGPARPFADALRREGMAVIAEVKRSSPSAGRIAGADAAGRAALYESAGAAAISVLTESEHFGGSLADLEAAAEATTSVPVLRKDFLLEPVQLTEARASGADAVLLISASLRGGALAEMLAAARELGLGVLLETHSTDDLERALETGAEVVGVNARDLETLEVDVERALDMLRSLPSDRIGVLESGVSEAAQVAAAAQAGARAVLVGEALMRAADPTAKIRELGGT